MLAGGESRFDFDDMSQTPSSYFDAVQETSDGSFIIKSSSSHSVDNNQDEINPNLPENLPLEMCTYDEFHKATNKFGDCYSSCDDGFLKVVDRTDKVMICCCGD